MFKIRNFKYRRFGNWKLMLGILWNLPAPHRFWCGGAWKLVLGKSQFSKELPTGDNRSIDALLG
jgi:hypothetical protein